MFLFLNRKERSVLSAEPISALFPVSLCHFLASSHGKQTIRQIYMSQIRFFCLMTLFCPSPLVLSFPSCHLASQSPITQLSQIHISHTHSSAGCDSCEPWSIHRDCLPYLKRVHFISSQGCIHEDTHTYHVTMRQGETARSQRAVLAFAHSISRVTIWTYLTINQFGRHVSQSMTHQGLGKSDKTS